MKTTIKTAVALLALLITGNISLQAQDAAQW